MKQPFPDLQTLVKEVEALTQRKSILETTITASQKEWDKLKKRIADQTAAAIEKSRLEIAEAVKTAKEELSAVEEAISVARDTYNRLKKEQDDQIADLGRSSTLLHEEHGKLLATNNELTGRIDISNVELESKAKKLEQVSAQKVTLDENIAALSDKRKSLKADISGLDKQIEDKRTELSDLEASAAKRLEDIEASIATLTAKERDLSNKLLQSREEDDKTRAALALWHRKLEDQDKNLRIREARVTQQEESISRNHNLLNL